MISTLITSRTRVKLLLKFFLNPKTTAYLRALSQEFGESTNGIRIELARFEQAGMLTSKKQGNRKFFKANTAHPLYQDVHNMLLKFTGLDLIIDLIIRRLGSIHRVYLEGKLSEGKNSDVIDLILISKNIELFDRQYLTKLICKLEKHLKKHIRYILMSSEESDKYLKDNKIKPLLIWCND